MVGSIQSGAVTPPSKAFEPNQAPPNPYKIGPSNGPALKPEKIAGPEQNPALKNNAVTDGPSELSKLNARGSTLDISV